MSSPARLRLGVLGAAAIARRFIEGVAPSTRIAVTAIGSRDAQKAAAFASEMGVERHYGSYAALLADDAIDAVYLPLPNGLHAEWAVRALEAGKHVLCEKPIAISASEARMMFDAAKAAGRHLVEGYPYLSQPQTLKMRELIAEGAIGSVHLIRASFGVNFTDRSNIRFDPALGGGALLDAGSYAVSLVRVVAGMRPTRVHAHARFENGVDLSTLATLEFPNGILAQVSCSFETAFHRQALIAGDAGVIETRYLNHPPVGGPPVIHLQRGAAIPLAAGQGATEIVEAGGNGFQYEAEAFARLVFGEPGGWNGATPEESIDIMLILDAIARSSRDNVWVDVAD